MIFTIMKLIIMTLMKDTLEYKISRNRLLPDTTSTACCLSKIEQKCDFTIVDTDTSVTVL